MRPGDAREEGSRNVTRMRGGVPGRGREGNAEEERREREGVGEGEGEMWNAGEEGSTVGGVDGRNEGYGDKWGPGRGGGMEEED